MRDIFACRQLIMEGPSFFFPFSFFPRYGGIFFLVMFGLGFEWCFHSSQYFYLAIFAMYQYTGALREEDWLFMFCLVHCTGTAIWRDFSVFFPPYSSTCHRHKEAFSSLVFFNPTWN